MAEIRVLGPVEVLDDSGAPVALRSALQRLLLAVLVTRRDQVVGTDQLVDALWGHALPAQPKAALQSQVFRLRRQLGSAGAWLETHETGYRLACGPDQVDAARFEQLVGSSEAARRADDPEGALADLDAALGLWRGRAYEDVADQDAIRVEAARLDEQCAEATEVWAELLVGLGRPGDAIYAMERLSAEQPFRERPVALQMRALAGEGRHVDALRVFEGFRRRLAEELGLEPSPELRAVEGEILRHELPSRPAIGLPANSFVGRAADVERASARLAEARLVTLTGPGGVGKTRLAAHVAAAVSDRYPEGVHLCELAHVTDPEAVAGTVASTLQVKERVETTLIDRLVEFLSTKRLLLLLDNCEHLLDSVNELLEAILGRTTNVDVLATSRQRLGVTGEQLLPVQPLPIPGDDPASSPATTLFADRAAAVRPDFALTDDNLAVVAALCRHLEGLPLALELAAARSVSWTPAEILAEVTDRAGSLADRRRRIDRHRSMSSVVAWSYDLLPPDEQAVCQQLAIFAGGWTAEAASTVVDRDDSSGTSADEADNGDEDDRIVLALTALVEHSLITAHDVVGRTRFSMLEPVRQYAEARLSAAGRADQARARHARWAVAFMETADAGLRGPDEAHWVAAIDTELANLRAAHRWCLAHDADRAARLAGALFWYGYWYAPSEVFGWADQTVERFADTGQPPLTGAFATAALGAWRRGDLTRARTLAARGIETAPPDDPTSARFAWEALRTIEGLRGDYEQALACHQQALALARQVGDRCHEAHEHIVGALALGYLGKIDQAQTELDAATRLLDASDHPSVRALCDYVAGEILVDSAPGEALPFLRRSRDAARRLGNRFIAGVAGVSAVSCAARLGDPADAIGGYAELIDYFHRAGLKPQLWTTIRTLIETLARLGHDEPAVTLHGALTTSPTAGALIGTDAIRIAQAMSGARTRLGEERFTQLHAHGATLDDEQATAYALATTGDRPAAGHPAARSPGP